jgi:hypothetical protein
MPAGGHFAAAEVPRHSKVFLSESEFSFAFSFEGVQGDLPNIEEFDLGV